ncbi:ribonuclease E G chloroplastic [Chlorella sorokiniana]|uniref:Ribonuclease E G chloroplastic n=1 Tax=Chlorella sorokiniana TaxID=3076 RepID=A0A2P6TQV9_CHLSO|nr:ribonuclease E G chloroplastic [Chlorella sorokiniana]|eukprot:PRW56450.1 ribonuclease E G chloroplastic [Chlorella sorokiniana]
MTVQATAMQPDSYRRSAEPPRPSSSPRSGFSPARPSPGYGAPGGAPTYGAPGAGPVNGQRPTFGAPAPGRRPAGATPGGPPPLLRVVFQVPECRLIFGEQLILVGAAEELGAWDVWRAPRMVWQEGDTWAVEVALPAGQLAFKLVVMRADGCCYWEDGPDRELEVPEGAAAVAAAARTGIRVACRFGDATDTDISLASAAALDAAAPKVLAAELASFAVEASPVAASQRPGASGPLSEPTLARAARMLEPNAERASPAELNLQLA